MSDQRPDRDFISKGQIIRYAITVAVVILVIVYSKQIISIVGGLWRIIYPLVLGSIFAYIVNIVIIRIEKIYFPDTRNRFIIKTKPIACLLLSILLIIFVLFIIINLIVPEVASTISEFAKSFPTYLNSVIKYFQEDTELPIISETLRNLQLDWNNIFNNITSYFTKSITDLLTSTFSVVGNVTSAVINFFIAFTFMIYILLNKVMVFSQINKVAKAFIKPKYLSLIKKAITIADECFSSFIVGQCTEAVILGVLCTMGMLIFRFPFAIAVGACVGATALIPVFGAYIGTFIGVLLILTVDPIKALFFVIYILILQQLENNFIYPKVIGTSIGLPGIWVFAAITMGAGLGGIMGMLLSVPIAATIYKLLRITINERLENT